MESNLFGLLFIVYACFVLSKILRVCLFLMCLRMCYLEMETITEANPTRQNITEEME